MIYRYQGRRFIVKLKRNKNKEIKKSKSKSLRKKGFSFELLKFWDFK